MRILHITAQKPDSTGSGVYLAETVRALDRAGHEQAVVCGIAPGDPVDLPQGVRVRPVVFDTPALPFHVVGMSDSMPYPATRYRDLTTEMTVQFKRAFNEAFDDVCAEFTPDLVICHHLYLVCAVMAHRAWPCPITAITHGTDMRQMCKIPLERAYIREGVQRLDRIFALHDEQVADIEAIYGVPAGRVKVVGVGYNARIFQRQGNRARGAGVRIAYAGKIAFKKGVSCLIAALDRTQLSPRDTRVDLAGGYSVQEEYDLIAAQAATSRWDVRLAGKLPQPELARLYNAADIFVLPSFFEGLPLVVVEALACGCAVVVTDLPGIRPWLAEHVPDAPVFYVAPPRMRDTDEPLPEDLPAFEERLAAAIDQTAAAPVAACDTSSLSWDALAQKLVE